MFKRLTELTIDERGFLADDRGIKYPRAASPKTLSVKLYGKPFISETPVNVREYLKLEKELETLSPKPNAWLDAGVVDEGIEILELPDIDPNGIIHREEKEVSYEVHRLEFYHLGE